ncbi:DDE-type integrase/transposase/recombinase [Granulicella sp. dw_53]|uniref:DDE-type integrase/transposase/recombinase n=1 Tax=Granulicella sp. dw_53 TaxID=2719792 RepID=UPI001BD236A9|nr:DDE-type integrase/transposase/recombinase [Granulicella sp. dw_53]
MDYHYHARPPLVRYEHPALGDMVHFDIKRLVRIQRPSHRVTGNRRDSVKGIGAEFLHIAIDDHSRLAFTAMYPNQKEESSTHFLAAATPWFKGFGIHPTRVLTDNGPCYVGRHFQNACHALGLKHRKTRPTPTHQRQGGTLHPNCAQRMGLRPDLSKLRAKHVTRRGKHIDFVHNHQVLREYAEYLMENAVHLLHT